MKKKTFIGKARCWMLLLLLLPLMAGEAYAQDNHWTYDQNLFDSDYSVTLVVQKDGVEQTNLNLEIGAFSHDFEGVVFGSQRPQLIEGRAVFFLTIGSGYSNGELPEYVYFKLYDHSTGRELGLHSPSMITSKANMLVGTSTNPFVMNFISGEPTWNLVTDASTLSVGDNIIIAANDYECAMSVLQKTSYRGSSSITIDDNVAFWEVPEDGDPVQEMSLQSCGLDNALSIFAGNGFLYASSRTSDQLKTEEELDDNDNGCWSFEIDDDGIASIQAQGNNTHNLMQYATSNGGKFACYASATQKDVSIYRLTNPSPTTTYMVTLSAQPQEGGSVTGSGEYEENTNVTVTATPNTGYNFVNWKKGNTIVSTDAVYTFAVTEDVELVASFAKQDFTFIGSATDHNWSTAGNWNLNALPAETDDVFINGICELDASATVASLTVNAGKSITVKNGKVLSVTGQLTTTDASQLVVEDGGQLLHSNDALATVKKSINGYVGSNDNYYLIASPVTDNTSVANLTANEYDLYTFDQSEDLEWRNQHENAIVAHKNGYLYANSEDVTLEFAGTVTASAEATTLDYVAGNEFTGFNLIGNPFPCNAYIENSYLRMNEGGTALEAGSGAIAPCEAVFVEATAENQTVAFSKTATRVNAINISVSRNRGASCDRAIVRFGGKSDLHKMTLNEGSTKLYIPQYGEDFAAICSQTNEGEIPVNFKAAKNGTYTIAVNTENVTADYLHLIDNLMGADVNLLETSSYSFEAMTSDYASRFQLVFGVKDAEPAEVSDTFAFISNGEIIISNEGRATLQVIDVKGRIIRNQQIEGNCRISTEGMTAGVYVLNLNGKTQKIVVK